MEDLSFVPDLPSGPLDAYRSTASFDWKRLKLSLEGDIDLLKLKYKVWRTLEKDPLFAHPTVTPSVEEQKRLTQLQVRKINSYKFLSPEMYKASYSKRTRAIMTINEAVQSLNPSVSVKMAIGIYLFSNALLSLGTERHLYIYEASIINREILASFALTEIAHGSDARLMCTTATYDAKTKQFVIHTPDFKAAKCWVGNLGRTCTHTLLFAQLITPDGTNHGLHGFVVPVRDPETLETYPGLIVGDMGEKIGVNGIDNGFIMFNQYRIPRENLLNRTADVTEDGTYESSFSEPSRILGAALENLSAGRVGIMQESCHTISSSVAIAIRYAATRCQFGTKDNETPLLEYQLHQWRLFGYVSAAVVMKMYLENFSRVYLNLVEKSHAGMKVDNLSGAVAEIHAMVSCTKPLLTWRVLAAVQECREACGGHGYLKAANFGELRSNHEPTVTYEGDNSVLSQQAGNWLLRQYETALSGHPVESPLGTVEFLMRIKEINAEKFKCTSTEEVKTAKCDNSVLSQQAGNWLLRQYETALSGHPVESPLGTVEFLMRIKEINAEKFKCTSTEEVKTAKFIISTYQWLLCWLLQQTHDKYEGLIASGLPKNEAKSKTQVYRWRTLTTVYAEYLTLMFSLQSIERKDKELQPVLYKLFVLYGLCGLDGHSTELYQGGFASGESPAALLREAILEMCASLKGEVVGVVDALAPTDFVLNSVLGKSDGNLYQNLQKLFFHGPGAMERATWWREVVNRPNSKL